LNKIAFAFDYEKLPLKWEGKTATLLKVVSVNLSDQQSVFIAYDTKVRKTMERAGLLDGPYLLLCFLLEGVFFTTLRKDNEENQEKYFHHEFETFELIKV